jgi:hypothetical protein
MLSGLIAKVFGEAAARAVAALIEGARAWWRDLELIELGERRAREADARGEAEARAKAQAAAAAEPRTRSELADAIEREGL